MNYPILLFINGLTWFFVLAEALFPIGALRYILGIPFLLCFPGYSVLVALRMETTKRIALSVILSLLIVSLIGFGLNYTHWGITVASVTYSVALFNTASSIFAAIRQRKLPSENNKPAQELSPEIPHNPMLSIAAMFVVVGALAISVYFIFAHKSGESFTAFSVASSNQGSTSFPNDLIAGENFNVFILLGNQEGEDEQYQVQVIINGSLAATSPNITLANGQTFIQQFPINFPSIGKNEKVEFSLFKNGQAYLSPLYLWFNITD